MMSMHNIGVNVICCAAYVFLADHINIIERKMCVQTSRFANA